MALTYLNSQMIEIPATIADLSASNLQVTNLSVSNLNTFTFGNASQWNQAYNVATVVQSNSASWEETADIVPTITNYLSTSNILLSSLTVTGDVSSTGTISTNALNIVSGLVFPKTTFNNLVSALAINVNGTTLYMPLLSAI